MLGNWPEWAKRAIRLAIGVGFFCLLGHGAFFAKENVHFQNEFRTSCQWAAITCVVVTAPVIGKVAQVSMERTVGTIIGGFLGYVVFDWISKPLSDDTADIILSLAAALVASSSVIASFYLKLDQSTKLYAITFLIVTMGAKPDGRGALFVVAMRVGGIIAGMILTQLLSILVLPKSATVGALRELRRSLKALTNLNRLVWLGSTAVEGPLAHSRSRGKLAESSWNGHHHRGHVHHHSVQGLGGANGAMAGGYDALLDEEEGGAEAEAERRAEVEHERACEAAFSSVYSSVAKVSELLDMSKGEVYVFNYHTHYFFLPAVFSIFDKGRGPRRCFPWQWQLPVAAVDDMCSCIRRLARLLWTLNVTFEEGFDNRMMAILSHNYPSEIMPLLAHESQQVLQDVVDAFPAKSKMCVEHLDKFGETVNLVFQIADNSRRNVVAALHTARGGRVRRARSITIRDTDPPFGVTFTNTRGEDLGSIPTTAHPLLAVAAGAAAGGPGLTPQGPFTPAAPLTPATTSGGGVATTAMGGDAVGSVRGSLMPPGSLMQPIAETRVLSDKSLAAGLARAAPAQRGLEPAEPATQPTATAAAGSASGSADGDVDGSLTLDGGSGDGSTRGTSGSGSGGDGPAGGGDAGVDSMWGSLGAATTRSELMTVYGATPFVSQQGAAWRADLDKHRGNVLQRLRSVDFGLFPPTEEGHVSQVRWYSFQFLLDELADELEELVFLASHVMASLPYRL